MSDLVFPPALILLFGAIATALSPRRLRPALVVAFPLLTLWHAASLPMGALRTLPFLTYSLEVVRVDALSRLFALIFAGVSAIYGVYAWRVDDRREQIAALLYTAGALGVVFAGDFLTFYVFWAMMAFAAAVLVWVRDTAASRRAGTRYLLVHLSAEAVLLLGIILHAQASGSILLRAFDPSAPTLGAWCILTAVAVNAAVPPLGAWLPDAYPKASVTGAVLMSALTTKAAVYVMLRAFPGWEPLVVLGVAMALYGVVYAVLANDIRELLAYHIISQVGYMVAGCGIGTPLAINGATAHAVCHILYKSLLFMGAGVVLTTTGRSKLTELGGFASRQRVAFVLYMIGAFSISGFPLWNGFISKSMVVAGAEEVHRNGVVLLLMLASVGTFLHTGLKLPYFTWLGPDRGILPAPTPTPMLLAMATAAFLCTLLGVRPDLLYGLLPYPSSYQPYTAAHVVGTVQLAVFTFFAFWVFAPSLGGEPTISVDTDVVYRKGARPLRRVLVDGVDRGFGHGERIAARIAGAVVTWTRDPGAVFRTRESAGFDPARARTPLVNSLTLALLTTCALAALALLSR